MSSNRNLNNMNFDPNSFTNLISSHQSASPQQNMQQFGNYTNQNQMQQSQFNMTQNQNPLTNNMNNSVQGGNNNSTNPLFQSLNLPPQLVQQQQQQVAQIQQQQLLQQQQRRSYTQQQIREVQGLIEKCLTLYLTKDEVIGHLNNVEPYVIKLVWLKLEEQNPEFFHSYNIRLQIKSQIDMFNTLVKDQASLMSQQQQQQQQLQVGGASTPSGSSTSPLRQTPTNPMPTNSSQGQGGPLGANPSLNIYNLLVNNGGQNNPQQATSMRTGNPSPFQNPNMYQNPLQNVNQYQSQLLGNQRLGSLGNNMGGGQLGQQRMGGGMGAGDMSYLLMGGNGGDLSSLLQQNQNQNQYQGQQMGGNLFSQYGNNQQQDQLSMLLQQNNPPQQNQYGQFTGPGGGGMNGSIEQQSLNMLQQQLGNTGTGYSQLQNFQFPPNTGNLGMMNMNQNNKPQQNNGLGLLNGMNGMGMNALLEDTDNYGLESNFGDNTGFLNEIEGDNTFSSQSGEDDGFPNDQSSYQIL